MKNAALFRAVLALALLGLATSGMAQIRHGPDHGHGEGRHRGRRARRDRHGHQRAHGLEARGHHGQGRELRHSRSCRSARTRCPPRCTGFKAAKRTGVRLSVDQTVRIDLDLQTGDLSEAVEVQAGALALDSETATVGQVITEKQITDLPLERAELPVPAVPGRGRRGGRRRAGQHAAGRGQRDQHHGLAADLEQLHDRRDVERRHRARHPRRHPVHRRPRGVQGADEDLLRGVRLQRQPDQPGQQVGDQRVPRHAVRVHEGRLARRQELLRPPRQGEARARPEAVRGRGHGAHHQEQDVLPGQLRRHPHRPWVQLILPGAQSERAARPLLHDDHRPHDRPAVPEQHHPRVALLAPRAGGAGSGLVPRPQLGLAARELLGRADASPDPEPVHGPDRPGPGPLRPRLRPLHRHEVREPTDHGEHPGALGPDLHPERQELAGVPHLAHPQQRW